MCVGVTVWFVFGGVVSVLQVSTCNTDTHSVSTVQPVTLIVDIRQYNKY